MTYVLGGFCVLLPVFWLVGFVVGRSDRAVSRERQRPGYIQPLRSVSGSASRTTEQTRERTATSTASKTRTAATPGLRPSAAPVRTGSLGNSGDDTAFSRGDLTMDAEPLRSTDWMIRRVHRDPSRIVERGWSTPVLHSVKGDAA